MAIVGTRRWVLDVERKFELARERDTVGKKESRSISGIWSGKFYDQNDF
jgi:hypothetical protein